MEKKLDLRVQKTYHALTSTFLQMLSEMPFEQITINELCDRAMVRRATFYKHFTGKYDFFLFFAQQIREELDAENTALRQTADPLEFYLSVLRSLIRFLKDNEAMVHHMLKSAALLPVLDMLTDLIYDCFREHLLEDTARGYRFPASLDIVASFYAGGLVRTLRGWLTQEPHRSEEALLSEIEALLRSFQPVPTGTPATTATAQP